MAYAQTLTEKEVLTNAVKRLNVLLTEIESGNNTKFDKKMREAQVVATKQHLDEYYGQKDARDY